MTPCKTCSKPAFAAGAKTPINAKRPVDLPAGPAHADEPRASDHHAPAAISHRRPTPSEHHTSSASALRPPHTGDHRPPATKPPSVNTFWPLITVQRPAASTLDPRPSCNGAKARITRLPSPAALRCPPHEMQPGAPFIGHPNHPFPRATQNTIQHHAASRHIMRRHPKPPGTSRRLAETTPQQTWYQIRRPQTHGHKHAPANP